MERSLTKTLANKHKSTAKQMRDNYRATVETPYGPMKCLKVTVERAEGKKPLVAYFGGIPLRRRKEAVLYDHIPRMFDGTRSELVKRLLANTCEMCGSKENIEVHVRRFGGRDRAHQMVRELMEGSLYTPLTLPSKEEGDQSMWGRPCRGKSGVNPFYRTQEEVNFRFNQARMSVPRRFQKSSQVARSSQCA